MRTAVLLLIVFVMNLFSQEILALLKGVENNHKIHMQYKNKPFICSPYGIETISYLMSTTDVNSSCKKHLNNFRLSNPKEKYFVQMSLHVKQQYTIEAMGSLCLLKLSNDYSLSEALIEEGYARIPLFLKYENPLLEYRFKKALQRAKHMKSGMWSDFKVKNCFLLTPKK